MTDSYGHLAVPYRRVATAYFPITPFHKTRFPLAVYGEHKDDLDLGNVAIWREMAVGAVADDEFTHAVGGWVADA